jgi:plastocyanin
MVLGGAALTLGDRPERTPSVLAGGWASLELLNPVRVAVVDVPVVIDAQVLQHGVTPNPDFGGAIRFIHAASGTEETLRLETVSRAYAIARGEHAFAEAGTWRMVTSDMGPEVELGSVEVVAPDDGDVISALWTGPDVASACGDVATGPRVETDILSNAFADVRLEVVTGTTVTWVNTSMVPHQVVFDDAGIDGSMMLKQDDRFSVTFTDPGEYAYHCAPHPYMTAIIAVTDA